eukprot:3792694-Prymnesium_polylepis.1
MRAHLLRERKTSYHERPRGSRRIGEESGDGHVPARRYGGAFRRACPRSGPLPASRQGRPWWTPASRTGLCREPPSRAGDSKPPCLSARYHPLPSRLILAVRLS